MEYIVLAFVFGVLMLGGVIYASDRQGWHATFKRVSTFARASVESGKPVKAIAAKAEKVEKDKWTAEFEGKALESEAKHVIVKTWFAKYGGSIQPFWKCKCGVSDWHVNIGMAASDSKSHVKEQNKAEEMMALNGGTHAW